MVVLNKGLQQKRQHKMGAEWHMGPRSLNRHISPRSQETLALCHKRDHQKQWHKDLKGSQIQKAIVKPKYDAIHTETHIQAHHTAGFVKITETNSFSYNV